MTTEDVIAQPKARWWVAGIIVALLGTLVGWMYATEDVARYLATIAAVILAVVLVALVFILFSRMPGRRRLTYLATWFGVVAGSLGFLVATTRWEGSLTGGAIPRLVWKWAKKLDEKLPTLTGKGGEASLQADEASFSQFLGAGRDGVLKDLHLDPDWEANPPKELWRREIGAGWSGFAVAEGRAVTQEQRGPLELVTCYDLGTGEPLWTHENETRFSEAMGGDGPRATPTLHGGRVCAMGGTGILDCLELSSGKLVWTRNILDDHGSENVLYGKACSPLVVTGEAGVPEMVVVTGGKAGKANVLAYALDSGEPVWAAGEDAASYASPVLTTLAGRRQIVSLNHNGVTGHDLASGLVLWTYKWPAKMPKSAQPQMLGDDRIFVSASYGMGSSVFKVNATAKPDEFVTERVWKSLQMKTKFSNVNIVDGHAYGLDEGKLACVDLATGKRKWRGTNYGYGQNLVVGNHILVQAERGDVVLVEATADEFKEVARLGALTHKTWNTPALAGEYLLVRNDREAACYKVILRDKR